MNLLLIRHAMTDWADKRLSGWLPDIHLNDEGRRQANDLATRLAAIRPAALYASPLERALETAQPLADAWELTIQVRRELIEANCGQWAGRMLSDLKSEALWPVIQVYPGGVRFPAGESFQEVQMRMVAQLDAIREAHSDQTVAVVSHADPIKMAVAYYAGMPLDLFHRLSVSPASVTALAFARVGPHLLCLNSTDSLPCFKTEEHGQDKEP